MNLKSVYSLFFCDIVMTWLDAATFKVGDWLAQMFSLDKGGQ